MELQDIQSKLKERIAKGLNFGIEAVEEVLDPDSQKFNDYILLKSKYNDLMYMSSLNTLPYEQIEIGLNRLRKNLIDLINSLEPESLIKKEVDSNLKIQALPTRRTNFFKLLDIHFKNLESVNYVEIMGDEERRAYGREAIFKTYQNRRRYFRNKENIRTSEGLAEVKAYFSEYFGYDPGMLEVYFKNIKHLLQYVLDSEVEQAFFMDTIRSLFSRSELAMIFYYAFCEMDPGFREMVVKSKLIDDSVREILIVDEHLDMLN